MYDYQWYTKWVGSGKNFFGVGKTFFLNFFRRGQHLRRRGETNLGSAPGSKSSSFTTDNNHHSFVISVSTKARQRIIGCYVLPSLLCTCAVACSGMLFAKGAVAMEILWISIFKWVSNRQNLYWKTTMCGAVWCIQSRRIIVVGPWLPLVSARHCVFVSSTMNEKIRKQL